MTLRILFVTWEFPPHSAGIGSYVYQMSTALKAAGHHVCVVTGRVAGAPEHEANQCGSVYRLYDQAEIGSQAFTDRILAVCAKEKIDWIEGADHWGECASIIRRAARPKVLIKAHSSNALKCLRASQALYAWQIPLIRFAMLRVWARTRDEAFCTSHGDALIAPARRIVEELHKQGTRLPRQSAIIPNPTAVPVGWQNRESRNPTLLFVGRIDIGKGIQFIPSIIRSLVPEFPHLRVELAGPDTAARGLGPLSQWLARRCAGYERNLRFLGRLDCRELDEAYQRAWVVIVPSRWDNFPGAVLDAMARKKAIVASPHGGMPEMLAGTEGVVAAPESRLFAGRVGDFLRDDRLRAAAGTSVYETVGARYSPTAVVARYVEFLESVA